MHNIVTERLDKTGFNEQIIFQYNDAWVTGNQLPTGRTSTADQWRSHHELVSLCGYSVTVQDIVLSDTMLHRKWFIW